MPNISRKSDKKITIENIMKEERWLPLSHFEKSETSARKQWSLIRAWLVPHTYVSRSLANEARNVRWKATKIPHKGSAKFRNIKRNNLEFKKSEKFETRDNAFNYSGYQRVRYQILTN